MAAALRAPSATSLVALLRERAADAPDHRIFTFLDSEGNEAAQLVSELGAGVNADPADPEAVATAIDEVVSGHVPAVAPDSDVLGPFSRSGVAGRLAAVLDRVAAVPRPA